MATATASRTAIQIGDRVAHDTVHFRGYEISTFGFVRWIDENGPVLVEWDYGPAMWVLAEHLEKVR